MFRSARLRVTLITVVITMVVSGLFSLAFYHIAARELQTAERRQYTRLERAYAQFEAFPHPPMGLEQELAAHHLLLNLVYLNIIILCVAAGIGAFLARETLEPIERAMKLQGQFAADASHELRTPLTAMRSEIEVALRQKKITSIEARSLMKSNLEELAKLEGLASGLLQLAQLESAKKHFHPVHISEVITPSIETLGPIAKLRQVSLEKTGQDFTVMGDAGSLGQVLKILLDNAIKYGRPSGQVVVATKTSGHKGIIEVKDQGPGINEADLEHVFERFWRASSSRGKDQADGYGLGLAIAKEIIHLHQGEIRAANHSDGASISIELPLA